MSGIDEQNEIDEQKDFAFRCSKCKRVGIPVGRYRFTCSSWRCGHEWNEKIMMNVWDWLEKKSKR